MTASVVQQTGPDVTMRNRSYLEVQDGVRTEEIETFVCRGA